MGAFLTGCHESISAGDCTTGDITRRAHRDFIDVGEAVMMKLRGQPYFPIVPVRIARCDRSYWSTTQPYDSVRFSSH